VKRSVTVEVAGQKFTLKTDASEAYVESLAAFVTEKIAEVKTSTRTFSTHALAILAALNIADDLFQARQSGRELKRRVREKSERLLELLEKGRDS
jgi:cell division protein ZapA